MITLTPRVYNKDIKWSLLPSNKVDTVVMNPLINSIPAEDQAFHTVDFTECTVNGAAMTLPVANNTEATHWRYMSNTRWTGIGSGFTTPNLAKARMECVWATGKQRITVDQAITGTPIVELQLVGKSSVVKRGGSNFDSYPSIEDLSTKSFSLATWIEDHKTVTNDFLSGIYENLTVSMNPWIRKVVPAVPIGDNFADLRIPTTANDVLTNWYDSNRSHNSATADKWSETNSFGNDVEPFSMFPVGATGGDLLELYATCIRMRNLTLDMRCDIKKLSDHEFEISWEAPVQLSYIAAARSIGVFGGSYDIDNYAFVDNITNVIVNLKGRPFDSSTVDIKYGLDEDGNLSTFADELHPLRIEKSEALTLGSFDKSALGTDILAPIRYDEMFRPESWWNIDGDVVPATNTDYIAIAPAISVTPNAYYKIPGFEGDLMFFDAECKNGVMVAYNPSTSAFFRVPDGKSLLGISFTNPSPSVIGVYEPAPWVQTLSENILRKYKDGKYVVECSVPATWAIKQKLQAKSTVEVVLPNGQYIRRGRTTCTFEVKNIKKVFKSTSFVFQLKLMEV